MLWACAIVYTVAFQPVRFLLFSEVSLSLALSLTRSLSLALLLALSRCLLAVRAHTLFTVFQTRAHTHMHSNTHTNITAVGKRIWQGRKGAGGRRVGGQERREREGKHADRSKEQRPGDCRGSAKLN